MKFDHTNKEACVYCHLYILCSKLLGCSGPNKRNSENRYVSIEWLCLMVNSLHWLSKINNKKKCQFCRALNAEFNDDTRHNFQRLGRCRRGGNNPVNRRRYERTYSSAKATNTRRLQLLHLALPPPFLF